MGERRCETCKWWYSPQKLKNKGGECRRLPPRMTKTPTFEDSLANEKNDLNLLITFTRFPATRPNEWCGEYQSKEER